jgi:homocitrate synthase
VRFSTEDSLRSSWWTCFRVYEAVDAMGVDRVGVADTVGIGSPRQIYDLVKHAPRHRPLPTSSSTATTTPAALWPTLSAALEGGATHM